MRIARLELTRFGKFTDHVLEFPRGDLDLHIIPGLNEAGKTTIKKAIADLFYGIHPRTQLGFLHGMSQLMVGGVLEQDGDMLAIQRYKRAKNPLVGADGAPLPEATLMKWLGGTERDFFERNFGLDHESLVKGGQEILATAGDAGQMLFQAAAGVSGLHKFAAKLEEEAHALWADRKSTGRAYYTAFENFETAQKKLRDVTVTASRWLAARRAFEETVKAEEAAATAVREILLQRGRLDRIRRLAPAVARLRSAQAECAAIGSVPHLPKDAFDTLSAAQTKIHQAQDREQLMREQIERNAGELTTLQLNPGLIAHTAAVRALANRLGAYLAAKDDLPGVQREVDVKFREALTQARNLGWEQSDVDQIAKRLPSAIVRRELRALAQQQITLTAEAAAAQRAHDEIVQRIAQLDADATDDRVVPGVGDLEAALANAERLDMADAEPAARQADATAAKQNEAALRALSPWTGDEEALRELVVPTVAEVQAHLTGKSRLESRRSSLDDVLAQKGRELARAKVHAADARRPLQNVTSEALAARRHERDDLWHEVRSGTKSIEEHAERYEGEVRAADELADRRHENAAALEKAEQSEQVQHALEAETKELETQLQTLTGQIAAHDEAWQRLMATLGLGTMTPERFTAWSQQRDAALAASEVARSTHSQLTNLQARAAQAAATLRKLLAQHGQTLPEEAALPALLGMANAVIERHTLVTGQYNERRRALDKAIAELGERAQRQAAATGAVAAWQDSWLRKLEAANLASGIEPAGAEAALEIFQAMETTYRAIVDMRDNRIAAMRSAIDAFESDASKLADECLPEVEDLDPAEICIRLSENLRAAEDAQREEQRLTQEIVDARVSLADFARGAEQARAAIWPLLSAACVETPEALHEAIRRSDAARATEDRRRLAEEEIRTGSDGLPFEGLIAEVEGSNLEEIGPQIEEAIKALEEAETRRTNAIQARVEAAQVYNEIAGQDDAARAEAARQDALLGMGDAVDEYVRIMVAARLLRWAVERYRDEKQDPLLKRASELFEDLTAGAFNKLSLDLDTQPVSLTAHRPNNTMLTMGEFSTGTESQLYLAPRLAALELHLDAATALPFIGDDIFVDWSDDRSEAGFRALLDLARKTQVIVLTHHLHLVDVARKATGGKAFVHQL